MPDLTRSLDRRDRAREAGAGARERRARRARRSGGPGPGEVLLEVRGAGVCGTDLHIEADEYRERATGHDGPRGLGRRRRCRRGCRRRLARRPRRRARRTSRPAAPASGAATAGRTSAPSGARSARSSTEASRRGSSCPRRTSTASRTGSTSTRPCSPSRSRASATACSTRRRSHPATACWSPGRGPIGLLAAQVARALRRRRARRRPADGRAAARRRAGSSGSRRRQAGGNPAADFDVVIECSGSAGGAATCLEAAAPWRALRADRRVREARHRSARPRLPEGARRHVGLRVDAALLAAGARADRDRGASSSGRSSPRSFRSTDWERVFADLRAGAGDQGRVRPATVRPRLV